MLDKKYDPDQPNGGTIINSQKSEKFERAIINGNY